MIPDSYILPGNIICPDLSGNTIPRECCPAVFFAPKSPAGSADDYSVNHAVSRSSAVDLFGADSIAKAMADAYLRINPFGELTIIPYTPTGAAATSTVTLTGTATESSEITLFVNDTFVQVDVLTGDTAADISALIETAVNAATTLPITASDGGGTVTLTAKTGGDISNQIQVSIVGAPDGMTAEATEMSGGSGTPDYQSLLEAMGECCCYDFLGIPDNDSISMSTVALFYRERWGCECFVGGRYYNTLRGSYTDMITYLDDQQGENPFGSTIYICESEAAADYQKLAAFIGYAHLSTCQDPAKTWYKGELVGIPNTDVDCGECLTRAERNNIALNGGTTTINGPQGYLIIESDTGLGSPNAQGEVDLFLRYPQAAYQTMRFARLFSEWAEKFEGLNLSSTEINPPQGVEVLTPNMFVAEYKSFLRPLEGSLIENIDSALELVRFEQNPNNPSRADVCVFFDPISAFRQFAVTLKPRINLQEFV